MLGILILMLFDLSYSQTVPTIIGQDLLLNCNNARMQQAESYIWRRYIRTTFQDLQDGSEYLNTRTSQLTIRSYDETDTGDYRCDVKVNDRSTFFGVVLTVGEIVTGEEGTDLSIDCNLQTSQTIYWYKQLYQLYDNNDYSGTQLRRLTIKTLKKENAGNYQCGAYINRYFTYGRIITVILKVNGNWGTWSTWEECSNTCGTGWTTRQRTCTNPPPANGGNQCGQESTDTAECQLTPCSVNGNWGTWSTWEECSNTCGTGWTTRQRTCTNPAPANGGNQCGQESTDTAECQLTPCSVNGNWATWSTWGECSNTCGTGWTTRQRTCTNPAPANGGNQCGEESTETAECQLTPCSEPERLSSESAVIGGAIGGILVAIIITAILCVIYIKRRKSSPAKKPKRKVNKKLLRAEASIKKQESGNQRGDMYVNIAQSGRFSSTDTDGDLPSDEPMANGNQNTENDYYNADELTTVKVDDFKNYIAMKDVSDGLKTQYKSIPYGAEHPTTKAQTNDNMPKNRFKTTFPYDHSRVILEPEAGGGGSDYINANFIDGFEKERCYIASQGPLKHTISDHWRMVWQNNVRRIIMLTNCEEGGKAKCDRYWPVGAKPLVAGNLVLTLLTEKKRAAYVTRDISLENKKTKEKKHVLQYHFTAWPDHGTPDPLYLVLFHKHVKADQSVVESGPELVHCSAGIGRTGTYIALDALMEEGRETGYIDLVKFVKKMRYCRMNMVQTADQYECLHHALLEELTMKDTSIRKEQFNNIWREIESDTRPLNLQRLYEEYKMLEEHKLEHKKAAYLSALSTENKEKNRNQQIVPKDDCRLYLVSFARGRSDYINAVQAPSYTNFVGYLSTQLPLPDTKVDFWTMIKDHHSSTIVLILNDSSEADMVYTESHDSFTCGLFTGNITNRQPGEQGVTEVTMIMTKKDEKPREILLYQAVCATIPDKRVLCRLADILSTRISMTNDPVTVVSSDGAKNCGLFCAFMNAVSSMKIDEYADIFQIVRLLQLRRPEFFSEFQEYRMCYEALNFYLESSNVYANF